MDPLVQGVIVGISTFFAASGGFWVYLKHRLESHDANTRLLMGLAHDKIVYFGMKYIEKGFVTKDEYDDLIRYFYEPYLQLGGNGTAERIMRLVQRLPLTLENSRIAQIADEIKVRANDDSKPLESAEELMRRKLADEERRSQGGSRHDD